MLHEEVVRRRRWIGEDRFLHALNFCMLLPGPEAQQLTIYLGWLLHGTRGGLVAGILFVLPSALLLWLLSWLYAAHGHVPWVHAIFSGLQAAVLAIVLGALMRMGTRVLRNPLMWAMAGLACVLMTLQVSFPWIILGAGVMGIAISRFAPGLLPAAAPGESAGIAVRQPATPSTRARTRPFRVLTAGLVLWGLPVVAAAVLLGGHHLLTREGIFFSRVAMLTFGGAYAVLPYVSQEAVLSHQWLTGPQMLDGLGLAETTPGPLIMVLQFVGFLAAWNQPQPFSPLVAGTLGAAITTWTTFVPSFLWILLGAPHVERLRHQARMRTLLSAFSAATVGTMLYFLGTLARDVLLPAHQEVNLFGLGVAVLSWVMLSRAGWSIPRLVVAAAGAGFVRHLIQSRVGG